MQLLIPPYAQLNDESQITEISIQANLGINCADITNVVYMQGYVV